ncbi:hypothetical protein TRAPUB_12075 [Trametes pubescens]|uniref:Uncharacterized protein n=1 Tax=Trametes pubescens TaxID=154538 RepID=A0A1M2VV75_TRAPU|nr:hypothetical protein TRAPUB_12075 [Trametes pubescens]
MQRQRWNVGCHCEHERTRAKPRKPLGDISAAHQEHNQPDSTHLPAANLSDDSSSGSWR